MTEMISPVSVVSANPLGNDHRMPGLVACFRIDAGVPTNADRTVSVCSLPAVPSQPRPATGTNAGSRADRCHMHRRDRTLRSGAKKNAACSLAMEGLAWPRGPAEGL